MAYLSLYRKYRSQSFEEVSGQTHVTRTLQNAIRSGRIAHAYLFCGPRGTGKTSTARLLAKALNCDRGPTAEPCNVCGACTQIVEGRFIDLIEIDAASNRGIDAFRDLREKVANAPADGRYKVYIIDEVHQVTVEAFNAFLKTLEEPPPHVVFVMATTEAHKVPATIVSRCQKFEFRRASLEQLRERVAYVVEQEGAKIENGALDLIAREANGGWRDALSLLEQVLAFSEGTITAKDVYTVLGTVDVDTLYSLGESIKGGDGAAVYRMLDEQVAEGKDARQLLRDLTAHFRTLMLAAAGSPVTGEPAQAKRLNAQAASYGTARLIAAIEVLAQTDREARWSEQPLLLLELAVARLMHPREARAVPVAAQPAAAAQAAPVVETRPAAAPPPVSAPPASPPPRRSAPPPTGSAPPPRMPVRAAAEPSPFVDEEPPPLEEPPGFLPDPLDAMPLTLGDARIGDQGDDDFDSLFESAPPAVAPSGPPPREYRPPAATPAAPPPRSAPVPEPVVPAASASASGDSPDLGLIQRKWRLVQEELKRDRKMTVHACLADTQPDRFEGDMLVVRFPSRTMADMFTQRGKTFSDPLVLAIQRVTGVTCRVRSDTGPASGPAGLTAPRQSNGPGPATPPPAENRARNGAPPAATPAAPPRPATATAAPTAAEADKRYSRPAPPSAPSGAAPGAGGGSELVHNVLEVFEGQIVDDAGPGG